MSRKKKQNVVIFDYEIEFYQIMKNYSELEKFNIIYSAHANNYKEILKEHSPQLVVLNEDLSDVDIFNLCNIISEEYNIMTIICTSNNENEYKYKAFESGAIRLIFKPIKIKEFIHIINETIKYKTVIKMNKFFNNWHEFNLSSKEEFARDVSILIKLLLEKEKVSRKLANQISFILTEIQNNSIEHAHHNDPKKHIKVTSLIRDNSIIIRIEDEGSGFDYSKLNLDLMSKESKIDMLRARKNELKRPGGFGLALAKSFMDEIQFNDKGNIITLIKKFK